MTEGNAILCRKRNILQTSALLSLFFAIFSTHSKAKDSFITSEEKNSTKIYANFNRSVFTIENQLRRDFLLPGDVSSVGSSGIYIGNNNILTTYDSIENSDAIFLTDSSKKRYRGFIKSFDIHTNIAIVGLYGKISTQKINIPTKTNIIIGQVVYSIGINSGISGFMSDGNVGKIIDGIEIKRNDGIGDYIRQYAMTTLPIMDGGSGSPVFDTRGQLMGIVDFYALPERQYIGVYTLVIPSDELSKIADELIKYGKIDRPNFGLKFRNLNSISRIALESLKIDKIQGVLVLKVEKNSIGSKFGFRSTNEDSNGQLRIPLGDIITMVDNIKISTADQLERYIATKKRGANIKFDIIRNNKSLVLSGKIN